MKLFSFRKGALEEGMPIEPMSATLKQLSKTHKTQQDLGEVALFYWSPQQGAGAIEIHREGQEPQVLAMPVWKGKTKRTSLATPIPVPAVVRVRPEEGHGLTVTLEKSGAFAVAPGADATPLTVLPDHEGDTPMQTAARRWLRDGRVGSSSYALCVGITGVTDPAREEPVDSDIPWDAGDFERCAMFFKAVPEAREHLDKMLEQGPYWAAVVPRWAELENYRQYGENASIRDAIHAVIEPVRARIDAEESHNQAPADDDEPNHPAGPLAFRARRN
jgi:hypothetical protein